MSLLHVAGANCYVPLVTHLPAQYVTPGCETLDREAFARLLEDMGTLVRGFLCARWQLPPAHQECRAPLGCS